MYMRLAREYENIGEWTKALRTYNMFLEQPDAASIQITDIPDAYNYAKTLIDFNKSPKDWTFRSLASLEAAIREAIYRYQPNRLDAMRSKVNFFAVSWKQDEIDSDQAEEFSLKSYMRGNKVRYNAELDELSNANEAYLRTWGWSQYVSTWYLYFRKVNYPRDPEINGNWEWAGIYLGEKL